VTDAAGIEERLRESRRNLFPDRSEADLTAHPLWEVAALILGITPVRFGPFYLTSDGKVDRSRLPRKARMEDFPEWIRGEHKISPDFWWALRRALCVVADSENLSPVVVREVARRAWERDRRTRAGQSDAEARATVEARLAGAADTLALLAHYVDGGGCLPPETRPAVVVNIEAKRLAAVFADADADRIAEEVDALWFGRRSR